MLSQWWIIWVGNTFPQGDAGLLRLLAARNDLGPAPSSHQSSSHPVVPGICAVCDGTAQGTDVPCRGSSSKLLQSLFCLSSTRVEPPLVQQFNRPIL